VVAIKVDLEERPDVRNTAVYMTADCSAADRPVGWPMTVFFFRQPRTGSPSLTPFTLLPPAQPSFYWYWRSAKRLAGSAVPTTWVAQWAAIVDAVGPGPREPHQPSRLCSPPTFCSTPPPRNWAATTNRRTRIRMPQFSPHRSAVPLLRSYQRTGDVESLETCPPYRGGDGARRHLRPLARLSSHGTRGREFFLPHFRTDFTTNALFFVRYNPAVVR